MLKDLRVDTLTGKMRVKEDEKVEQRLRRKKERRNQMFNYMNAANSETLKQH